jgi:hypothetical protein
MSDRVVTAAGALLALAIVYVMFFQKDEPAPFTRPLSTETGRNGYAAVRMWLERSGVPVLSLTQRFDRLSDGSAEPLQGARGALPAAGHVLITTLPYRFFARTGEVTALKRWIRDGNTLLVMAALDDTPEWIAGGPNTMRMQLAALTGLVFTTYQPEEDEDGTAAAARVPAGARVELRSTAAHPLMQDVDSIGAQSDRESSIWYPIAWDRSRPLLRLAEESSSGIDAAWHQPSGNGHVIVLASAGTLSNHNVAGADTGRFLVNVLQHHLGDGGAVIFDDMHQGLSSLYDPAAFYRDPRLHATVLFLVAAWLAYLLGSSNRLAPPLPLRGAPRHGDFLAAAGGLLARRLDRRATGILLLEEWFDEVRRARGLPAGGAPPWDAIDTTPTLGIATRQALRRAHDKLERGRSVNLVRLHNTLLDAREAIG